MIDPFGREVSYLRVSVTDRCDFRCVYCMSENMTFLPKADVLSLEELDRLCSAFVRKGVKKLRLTGGEPLVRRNIMSLFRNLSRLLISGDLKELTLTSNGSQLPKYASELVDCGVKRINISMDSLDADKFRKLTRWGDLGKVQEGIRAARDAGLAIKINVVALRNFNDDEIEPLIRWCGDEGYDMTLIETMPLGDVDEAREDRFVSLADVRRDLESRWTLTPSDARTPGPSRYFDIVETGGRIGFITPMSENFCSGCNRLRVTATGQLYPCLGGGERVDLRAALRSDAPQAQVADALDRAMAIKPEKHDFRIGAGLAPTQLRHMSVTGG